MESSSDVIFNHITLLFMPRWEYPLAYKAFDEAVQQTHRRVYDADVNTVCFMETCLSSEVTTCVMYYTAPDVARSHTYSLRHYTPRRMNVVTKHCGQLVNEVASLIMSYNIIARLLVYATYYKNG